MKFALILFACFFTVGFISSCQKEYHPDITLSTTTGTSSSAKIKTYTEDVTESGIRTVVTFNIAYDASDRIVSIISASSPGDKFLFQYPSANMYIMDLYNSNILNIHEIFFLNSFFFVDSTFQYDNTNDTTTEKYFYNTAKQLIKQNEYDRISSVSVLFNSTTYNYNAGGNVATKTDNNDVTQYDYYTTSTTAVFGLPYFPTSKNLIKTAIYTSGGVTDTVNYTYTFDSNYRVSVEKDAVAGSTDMVIKTYTYY